MNLNKANLVQYSDSDEDSESSVEETENDFKPLQFRLVKQNQLGPIFKTENITQNDNARKRKKSENYSECRNGKARKMKDVPLPLPKDIQLMFEEHDSNAENLSHGGRKRSFPHADGDWASFVYIPVLGDASLLSILKRITDKASEIFPDLHPFDKDDLHITLSRTVSLRHYWIETMVSKFRDAFSCSRSFSFHLDLPEFYTNDEKTRTFLGVRVILGEEKLENLSKKVDGVFSEFGLPCYYENASFHVSIAWHLNDVTDMAPVHLQGDLQESLESNDDDMECRTVNITRILFKTGNKTYLLKDYKKQ